MELQQQNRRKKAERDHVLAQGASGSGHISGISRARTEDVVWCSGTRRAHWSRAWAGHRQIGQKCRVAVEVGGGSGILYYCYIQLDHLWKRGEEDPEEGTVGSQKQLHDKHSETNTDVPCLLGSLPLVQSKQTTAAVSTACRGRQPCHENRHGEASLIALTVGDSSPLGMDGLQLNHQHGYLSGSGNGVETLGFGARIRSSGRLRILHETLVHVR